jgi:hypothetical protein
MVIRALRRAIFFRESMVDSNASSLQPHDDRVIGDAERVDFIENLADPFVVHDHAVAVLVLALATILVGDVRAEVHRRRVVPEEKRLVGLDLIFHPRDRSRGDFLIDRLHALLGERPRVFDRLLPDPAPARILGRIVHIGRLAVQHAAWSEFFEEAGHLRIVGKFGFFFGVQMVQIPEEFVEPVDRRKILVAVAEMVLAELTRGISLRLQQLGDRRIFFLKTNRRARHADVGEPLLRSHDRLLRC